MDVNVGDEHQRALELLGRQLDKKVLPHAHLLVGPEGVGRVEVARRVAESLLCSERSSSPCRECRSCRLFRSGEHPDYHEYATPEDRQSLPIDSIRRLQVEASRKPVMGAGRVFVVRDAERMTTEAANSFLKTLEEPPGECCLLLIATGLSDLPETIPSRCQITKLTGLPPERVAAGLTEQRVGPDAAPWLAMRSWGSPGRARDFHQKQMHELNKSLLDRVVHMDLEDNLAMSDYLQDTAKKLGKNASEQRQGAQELLECLAIIYRDIAVLIEAPDATLFNEHARSELTDYAHNCELDDVVDCADRVLEAQYRIGANVNRRIVLDDLFTTLCF